jgi:hypothetical protein
MRTEGTRILLAAMRASVRYGTLHGPGTFSDGGDPPPPPRIHVDEAARRTVELLDAPSGAIVVTEAE